MFNVSLKPPTALKKKVSWLHDDESCNSLPSSIINLNSNNNSHENEQKKRKRSGRLWEFICNLLHDPETCPSLVRWENAEEGIFRFVQAEKVAKKWGEKTKNKEMNCEKLSRAMRYYHKGGLLEAVPGKRFVYKFGENAKNWRPPNPNFTNQTMLNIPLQPPTASNKKLLWLPDDESYNNLPASIATLNGTKLHDDDAGYIHKSIHSWTYPDVVNFMFNAILELDMRSEDLIVSELSGATGEDLCNMSVEDFKRFFPKKGERLYHYFFGKLQEERRHDVALVPSSQKETDLFQSIDPSDMFDSDYHPPLHPSKALVLNSLSGCDASAPYYEIENARSIGPDNSTRRCLSENLPSAFGKTFDLLHAPSPAVPISVDGNISDPDQSDNEKEVKPEPPKKRGPGRPRKPENELKKRRKKNARLWEFIRNLLHDPETCPSLVRWENAEEGTFKFVQTDLVAKKWGERNQNKDMNYEKLSRAMRYHYKRDVLEAVLGKRLVYKFGKNAKNWKHSNPNFTNQSSTH